MMTGGTPMTQETTIWINKIIFKYMYSDGHRLRTCFGKFNINFEPRATLDLEPKTIHLEPLIILNDISLCSIYVLTIIDRLGR